MIAGAVLLSGPADALTRPTPDDGVSLWRVFGSLLLCLALAVAGAFALRARFGGGGLPRIFSQRDERRLRLIESVRLNPHVQLCIVVCDGHELLVAASPQGATVLKTLSRSEPPEDGVSCP